MKRLVVPWNQLGKNDVSLLKRAVYFGDGFFETLRWHVNQPLYWEDHWSRIEHTCRALCLPLPCSETELLNAIKDHTLPDVKNQRVRASFIRTGEGHYTPLQNSVLIVVEPTPLPDAGYEPGDEPCKIGVSSIIKLRQPLSTLKLLSAQTYVVAALEARQHGWNEAILLNDAGNVCEAISHNVFVVKNRVISTPSLSEGCLQGVMRTQIIRLCKEQGWNIQERVISLAELEEADELFLTNVITGIRPATQFRNRTLNKEVNTKLCHTLLLRHLL